MNFLSRLCVAFLLVASVACSKQLMETEREADAIASDSEQEGAEPESPADPESEPKPSKYKPEELITVTFTADAEATKTTLGGDTGRSIFWEDGDQVMFVWGPDEDDRTIGTAKAEDISPDGRRATFTVDKVYAAAKTVYAVYPAGAFSSFTKLGTYDTDGAGTVAVSIGAMADGTRLDGSFGQADVCIARSSLETHKMKFKHLVAFVTVNASNKATQNVSLNGGDVAIGGILPVTVGVGDDGYTQTPVRGDLSTTKTSVTVKAAGVDGSTKTWIPVVAGFSFADGVALSYLDGSDGVIGQATLKKATSVALGAELTFPSTINNQFSKDYYVKSDADGTGDGSSWGKAWTYAQMESYVENADAYETTELGKLTADAPINIHIAAGTYEPDATLKVRPKYTSSEKTVFRKLNLIGGYPSSPTASSVSDPATNETAFSGQNSGSEHIVQFVNQGRYSVYGLTFKNHSGNSTGNTAVYAGLNSGSMFCVEFGSCVFKNNYNTGVGAALALSCNGAITTLSEIVKDCTFEDNESGGGGGINVDGVGNSVTVQNCTFKDNFTHAYSYLQCCGAAMKISKGSALIENCTFEGNYIDDDIRGNITNLGNGGALWLSDESATLGEYTITVNDCTFDGNYTKSTRSKGGAVFVQRYKTVVFNRCFFTGNECKGTANTSYGGAMAIGVWNNGNQAYPADDLNLTLNDCIFDGNLVASTKENGKAHGGGAIFMSQGTKKVDDKDVDVKLQVTINRGEIRNQNNEWVQGNGIFAKSGTLALNGCKIHHNRTTGDSDGKYDTGAGIFIKDANCTMSEGTSIYDNKNHDGGAGLMVHGTGNLTMNSGCSILRNETTGAGCGGLRVSSEGITLSLTGVTISGNSASGGYSGGVAIYKETSPTFTNCIFSGNHSNSYAGAVYIAGEGKATNTATFTDCQFTGNYSLKGGSAICVTYAGNRARDSSGEVATTKAATTSYDTCEAGLTVTRCTFTGNYSTSSGPGAIRCQTSGAVSISDSTFDGNYTSGSNDRYNSGGAMSLAYGQVSMAAGTEEDPEVTAGVVNKPKKGDFTITGCTFKDNHTKSGGTNYYQDAGGAISMGVATVLDSSNNVYAENYSLVKINRCNFIHNYATQGGALSLFATHSDMYISNSLFYRNYITLAGGSIISSFYGGLHINNSTMHDSWGNWNVAYINFHYGSMTLANTSIIGVPKTGESTVGGTGEALIRFDGCREQDQQRIHIINSIICSTQTDRNSFAIWQDSAPNTITLTQSHNAEGTATDKARGLMNTLYSGTVFGSTLNHPGQPSVKDDYWATTDYFGNLTWACTASNPTWENSYWSWNGSYTGGTAYMTTLANINNDLDNSDPNFYAWLVSIEDVTADHTGGKDQRGHDRSARTWQGAYNN